MIHPFLIAWSLPRWEYWLIPAAGIASAFLAVAVGATFFRRRKLQSLLPPTLDGFHSTKDPFVVGSATEKRTSLRRGGNPVEVSIAAAEPAGELTRGFVVDRSMGGLCLVMKEPVDKGTVVSVKPVNAPSTALWVQIQVKSCRQEGKEWELGCQFVRTPPWSVLLSFG